MKKGAQEMAMLKSQDAILTQAMLNCQEEVERCLSLTLARYKVFSCPCVLSFCSQCILL